MSEQQSGIKQSKLLDFACLWRIATVYSASGGEADGKGMFLFGDFVRRVV